MILSQRPPQVPLGPGQPRAIIDRLPGERPHDVLFSIIRRSNPPAVKRAAGSFFFNALPRKRGIDKRPRLILALFGVELGIERNALSGGLGGGGNHQDVCDDVQKCFHIINLVSFALELCSGNQSVTHTPPSTKRPDDRNSFTIAKFSPSWSFRASTIACQ